MGQQQEHTGGDVIVVAINVSKEITDYALEWAIRNVIKASDTLILLGLLPSIAANQNNRSGVHHFFTSVLKKWGLRGDEDPSKNPIKGNGDDGGVHKINEVCRKMINQLNSAYHVNQVETHVKIIADAQMGSVATKAHELGATWVILDRRLKKEGEYCLKQLGGNIILIDHPIPKVLRLVKSKSPPFNESDPSGPPNDPADADLNNAFPAYRPDSKGTTTPSSLGLDSQRSNTDDSCSVSSIEKDDDHQAAPFISNYQPSKSLIDQGSTKRLPNEYRNSPVSQSSASSTRTQEPRRVSKFDGDDQRRSPTVHRSTSSTVNRSQQLKRVLKLDGDDKRISPTMPRSASNRLHEMKWALKFDGDDQFKNPTTPTSNPRTRSQELKMASKFNGDDQGRSPTGPRIIASKAKSQELKLVSKVANDGSTVERAIVNHRTNNSIPVKQLEKPAKSLIPARLSVDSLQSAQHLDSPDEAKALTKRRKSFSREFKEAKGTTFSPSLSQSNAQLDRTSSIRKAISLSIKHPPTPPPLCSICKNNAPIFCKPPRKFSYKEIEAATDGFSGANFLAEGGYGPVYKGVLADGQVVAVKQHKLVSAQGASEFCAEVEVLSCAQHRNLVMLVGYCMEKEWLLVYEFACNGSLDKHLYGKNTKEVMAWEHRLKVAIGAARGLRYLHEDCRVGCIVHRDLRPNNILLTHDFKAMVGDFGLARWQADGESGEETRVVGALGYLAPEYTRTGQITEKADVYAFGILLMELLSGLKAIDFGRAQGQQFLPEWGRPIVEKKMLHQLIDRRLDGNYVVQEAECMMHAASLCIALDPDRRPKMSKVLKILEGDVVNERVPQAQPQHAQVWPSIDRASNMRLKQRYSESQREKYDIESHSNEQPISDQSENLASEEFQAYLHGSLAEFLQKMKLKSNEGERPMSLASENSNRSHRTVIPFSKRGITNV